MTRRVDRRTVLRTGAFAAVAGLPSVADRAVAERRADAGAATRADDAEDDQRRALVHAGTDEYDVGGGSETIVDVEVTPDGGRVGVGSGTVTGDDGEPRQVVVVLATDEAGEKRWMDTMRHYKYGGPVGVAATPDGGAAVCWARDDPNERFGVQSKLYRYDDAGNVLWKEDLGQPDELTPAAVVEFGGDKYGIVGTKGDAVSDNRAWLGVYDHKGNKYVDERYPRGGEYGRNVVQTGDRGYTILGFTRLDGDTDQAHVTRVDQGGAVRWQTAVDAEGVFLRGLGADGDGGVVATGFYTEDVDGESTWQGYFAWIDGDGVKQWTTSATDPEVDYHPELVQPLADGGFEFVGERYDGTRDTWIGRLNESGIVSTTKVIDMESTLGGVPITTADGGYLFPGNRYDHGEENDYMTVARLVRNEPPEPAIDYSPETPTTADEIELSAEETVDPNGNVVTYRWDVTGDGETDYLGDTVSLQLDEPGEYTITLEVEDADGATATTETTVVVERAPTPTPTATPTRTATPTGDGDDGGSAESEPGGDGDSGGNGGDGGAGDGDGGGPDSRVPGFGVGGAVAALGLGALARRVRRED